MKKVLILVNHFITLKAYRTELVAKLNELGYKVYVSTPFDTKENMDYLKSFGCELIETPLDRRSSNFIKDIKLYLNYKKLIKKIKPDIVLTYTAKPNIYGIKAASENNIPCFATITGLGSAFQKESLRKKIISVLYKWALPHATHVFCQNESNKNILKGIGAITEKQTVMTPGSGVNTEKFEFISYPQKTDIIHFLYTGRLMKEKGVDDLFAVIQKLKNNGYDNLLFHFIGLCETNYDDIINKLTEQGLIKYYGFQKDVKSFIEKCDCLILPSYYPEGMNNALLEAEAMGRPIITTNWPGCRETVKDNVTGFICEPDNQKSLYDSIIKFINLPYENQVIMGKNASKFVNKNFNRKTVVNIYTEYINKYAG